MTDQTPDHDAEADADRDSDGVDADHADDADHGADALDAPADVGAGLLETDMGPSSSLAHLYRGEIHRMKLWRERLDRTTNWAVIVLAGVLTWSFSDASHPHYVLLGGGAVLALFLVVEARRYRGYDIWRSRVRSLQRNVFAVGLDPGRSPTDDDWREDLADDYRTPTMKITAEEALAHRLRRIYLPLLSVLLAAWVVRVTAFGTGAWPTSAAVGALPGVAVTAAVAVAYLAAVAVACRPRTWHARGELRSEDLRKRR
ncbi:DUF2270 domain-containing protein [Halobacterium litoreum]|uniref:DUF2270 domain-containing protein n=1 Tax=Halobacterium litoreum TaxID=2039234 RepID=A0ABD5NG25_9EURY|nr:DUF2270 domain-containing protein [Halobacterium litoreum]UHH13214.1 DUF2270 domain-containing protein [Halobacterium litoreum]